MAGLDNPLDAEHESDRGPVSPGDVIDGKYRIERILGAGGMGVVAAATHLQLGNAVAVKIVRPEVAKHPQIVARFQREARIAAQLESDHVARVMDIGMLPGVPAGVPYMVLELLSGQDLAVLLAERGRLPAGEAVAYVLEACDAIAEAHGRGIIHRDLKPANLFLARRAKGRPVVKVLDFGISSMAAGDDDARLTATGSVMGTPLYMAPEQMLDARKADARSDVWALGAILYELLMGVPPFPGNTFGAVHAKVITTEAPPLRATRPDLPAALEAIVLRCLRKPPDERFPTVAALEEALRPFAVPAGAQPSLPSIEDAATEEVRIPKPGMPVSPPGVAAPPAHTTQVIGAGGVARDHTTLVLGQTAAAEPTAGAAGTSISWDAQTTLVRPPSPRPRGKMGVAVVLTVLGLAAVLLVVALVRFMSRTEPSTVAVAAPASAMPTEAPTPAPSATATADETAAPAASPAAMPAAAPKPTAAAKPGPRAPSAPASKPVVPKSPKPPTIAGER